MFMIDSDPELIRVREFLATREAEEIKQRRAAMDARHSKYDENVFDMSQLGYQQLSHEDLKAIYKLFNDASFNLERNKGVMPSTDAVERLKGFTEAEALGSRKLKITINGKVFQGNVSDFYGAYFFFKKNPKLW